MLHADFSQEEPSIRKEVTYQIGYKGYIQREQRQVKKLSQVDKFRIPLGFNYLNTKGLRKESALKLTEMRPMTLGQASRISGVNPADISVLMVSLAAARGVGSD